MSTVARGGVGAVRRARDHEGRGVRRRVVEGNLSGFFTIDDVLYLLGSELSVITWIIDQTSL